MPPFTAGMLTFLLADLADDPGAPTPVLAPAVPPPHLPLLQRAVRRHGGRVIAPAGQAFVAVFDQAADAVAGAYEAEQDLGYASGVGAPFRVHIALHSSRGTAGVSPDPPGALAPAAALLAAGHAGQILLTLAAREQVAGALPPGTTLRDLGMQRFPDLVHADHVFQLVAPDLPAGFPPLRTLDSRPNNLPAQLTPFVGRDDQIAALTDRLRHPGTRLLTLTGPGGTGKTRLAFQAAAALLPDFAHGVFVVNLAAIRDPELVLPVLATTLGVRAVADQPLAETLRAYLHDKQMMLLFDNFEQVAAAAPTLADLLTTARHLKLLITSRAALRIYGEQTFAVPPLALPDPGSSLVPARLAGVEAVQLFVDRAQVVQPEFVLTPQNAPAVAEICRRLDGLPLAIELAAARVNVLSPQALHARLGSRLQLLTGGPQDRPARQQALRNTLAWSYDLLPPAEQVLFRRLAVFQGGRTLEAIEAVCDLEGDPALDAAAGIGSLLSHSLLSALEGAGGERRFWMLETIHEYARERLAESGEDTAVRARHAGYFLSLVEQSEPRVTSAERVDWLVRLEEEHENLRAALAWSVATPPAAETALRLAGALVWFWFFRGYLQEGRDWLERALAAAGPDATPAFRAKALSAAGALLYLLSDYPAARTRLEAALALWRALGVARGLAYSLLFLSQVAARQGDPAAGALGEEALAAFRQANDTWGLALAHDFLGEIARARGDEARGDALHAESLALFRRLGDTWGIGMELGDAARMIWQRGDLATARAELERTLAIQRTAGDKWNLGWVLCNLGDIARAAGDPAGALLLLEESLGLFQALGDTRGNAAAEHGLGVLRLQQRDYAEATRLLENSLDRFQGLGDAPGRATALDSLGSLSLARGDHDQAAIRFAESLAIAAVRDSTHLVRCFLGLAAVAAAEGQVERAGRLCGAAEALFSARRVRWEAWEARDYRQRMARLRDRPDWAAFNTARRLGRGLETAQALAFALPPDAPSAPPVPGLASPAAQPVAGPARGAGPPPADPDALTPREVDVLQLVASGLTDAEVAARLVVSPRTVQAHLRSIYGKLEIGTRSAATRYAIQHQLA